MRDLPSSNMFCVPFSVQQGLPLKSLFRLSFDSKPGAFACLEFLFSKYLLPGEVS